MFDLFTNEADGTVHAFGGRCFITVMNPYRRAARHDGDLVGTLIMNELAGTTRFQITERHCYIDGYAQLLALPALSSDTVASENSHPCRCRCRDCRAYEAYADWYVSQPFSVRVAQLAQLT